jgi:YggT family protein
MGGVGGFLIPVIDFVVALVKIYFYVIIISVIVSWLIAFGVIHTYNRTVAMLVDALYRLSEPALRPIRRFLPNFGGLDISPVILLLLLWLIERELIQLEYTIAAWGY